ncbi:MAG: hypothetical protein AAB426_07460 [Myxococcota bacterium]
MPRSAAAAVMSVVVLLAHHPDIAHAQATSDTELGHRSGRLHRAAAAVDATLEIYRLALIELRPAADRLLEAGHASDAQPETGLPAPVAEVFTRLAEALATRIARDALPPVARGYHVEVMQALAALAEATTLGDIPAPLAATLRAMDRFAAEGDALVDLFSRQRPLEVHIIDGEGIVQEIGDALEEVARAEGAIARARQNRRSPGEQLATFMQLEISLAHALDLIAAAEDAGVHIGFELQLSTAEFAVRLTRVHTLLDELRPLVAEIARAPACGPSALRAVVEAGHDETPASVQLSWRVEPACPSLARLRLDRLPNVEAVRQQLENGFRCAGHTASEATQRAQEITAKLDPTPEVATVLESGRVSHSDPLGPEVLAPPRYRLVGVSSFGIAGTAAEAVSRSIPATLTPPELVEAHYSAPSAEQATFYRDLDAVQVRWTPAPSDLRADAELATEASRLGLPLVTGYRLVRHVGAESLTLATLAPGTTAYTDRPSPRELASGVRYGVIALGVAPKDTTQETLCASAAAQSATARVQLTLARAGLGQLEQPTRTERQWASELEVPGALEQARNAFEKRALVEQLRLGRMWWTSQPAVARQRWLMRWGDLATAEDLASVPTRVSTVSWDLARAHAWLQGPGESLRPEVERWWQLLTERRRLDSVATWRQALNPAARAWLEEHLASEAPEQHGHALDPARLLAWWRDRDPIDQRIVLEWWATLSSDEQRDLLGSWLATLPTPVRQSLRFPRWTALSVAERPAWLAEGYIDLPGRLYPRFLSWVRWHELTPAAKIVAVAAEAGLVGRSLAAARYRLRPLDAALGFRLPMATLGSLGLVMLVLLLVRSMRGERS